MKDQALETLAARIVQVCDPEEVFLYGSRAKGGSTPASDLDLLVVVRPGVRTAPLATELREVLDAFPLRIDLKVVTSDELERQSGEPYGFMRAIRSSGRTLYRRQRARP